MVRVDTRSLGYGSFLYERDPDLPQKMKLVGLKGQYLLKAVSQLIKYPAKLTERASNLIESCCKDRFQLPRGCVQRDRDAVNAPEKIRDLNAELHCLFAMSIEAREEALLEFHLKCVTLGLTELM
jgi:hypothetical protein